MLPRQGRSVSPVRGRTLDDPPVRGSCGDGPRPGFPGAGPRSHERHTPEARRHQHPGERRPCRRRGVAGAGQRLQHAVRFLAGAGGADSSRTGRIFARPDRRPVWPAHQRGGCAVSGLTWLGSRRRRRSADADRADPVAPRPVAGPGGSTRRFRARADAPTTACGRRRFPGAHRWALWPAHRASCPAFPGRAWLAGRWHRRYPDACAVAQAGPGGASVATPAATRGTGLRQAASRVRRARAKRSADDSPAAGPSSPASPPDQRTLYD